MITLYELGSVVAERDRLVVAFRDKAPDTELSNEILNRIVRLWDTDC
jgi:hypothetical protein